MFPSLKSFPEVLLIFHCFDTFRHHNSRHNSDTVIFRDTFRRKRNSAFTSVRICCVLGEIKLYNDTPTICDSHEEFLSDRIPCRKTDTFDCLVNDSRLTRSVRRIVKCHPRVGFEAPSCRFLSVCTINTHRFSLRLYLSIKRNIWIFKNLIQSIKIFSLYIFVFF